MSTEYTKPLPVVEDWNRPFWDAIHGGELRMQRCADCGRIRYPISSICSDCLSSEYEWTELSGRGEIMSYIVVHQVYNKAFADDVPYNVALIQLDEGPRMFSNIIGVSNDVPKVGDRVSIVYDRVTGDVTIPRFKLEP
jgi:uncharacterized OB-fold protein